MRRAPLLAPLIALAGLAGGCHEELDPLDPEVLQRIARAQGDALGDELAGSYLVLGTRGECDCPPVAELDNTPLKGVDLCAALGVGTALVFEVFQEDGLLAIDVVGVLALFGGVDEDGTFAVAGLFDAATYVVPGDLLTRVEGRFVDGAIEATIVNRIVSESDFGSVDCRATSTLAPP